MADLARGRPRLRPARRKTAPAAPGPSWCRPTFVFDGARLLAHLARPNPIWAAIAANPAVTFAVAGDYAYIPATWRAKAGGRDEDGVPTSYHGSVQFRCRAEIIDDPSQKAALLTRQLQHLQPQGDHAAVAAGQPPYGRLLPGIRRLRLHIRQAAAKFKYDDHNPPRHRRSVAQRLTSLTRLSCWSGLSPCG